MADQNKKSSAEAGKPQVDQVQSSSKSSDGQWIADEEACQASTKSLPNSAQVIPIPTGQEFDVIHRDTILKVMAKHPGFTAPGAQLLNEMQAVINSIRAQYPHGPRPTMEELLDIHYKIQEDKLGASIKSDAKGEEKDVRGNTK